jgi:hypothetical protein
MVIKTTGGDIEVPAFLANTDRLKSFVNKRDLRRIDHYIRMAILGCFLALEDADAVAQHLHDHNAFFPLLEDFDLEGLYARIIASPKLGMGLRRSFILKRPQGLYWGITRNTWCPAASGESSGHRGLPL